ncbi:HNH endonuclease [Methanococcoides methylutens]|uniref:HNH endonuclease n=1 Tax=Methanococcoides methylutens TaxID=2226 RepID=UPI00064F73BD|nr:HNH endonuclease [Methanococcoides methylutens]
MRCLFCKKESTTSKSVEHIIPESLGNLSHILPKGVVCDNCNNYFARKVEKPFLELPAMTILRFNQMVPNKRGSTPPVSGFLMPSKCPVVLQNHLKASTISVEVPDEVFESLRNSNKMSVILPTEAPLPESPIVSRFLSKVAIEAMALKLVDHPKGLEYIVDEKQLDPIRNHARYGQNIEWPYHSRRIYDANKGWRNKTGKNIQVVHEFDIFKTEDGEYYFVICIFGLEFSINYSGPEIEGYIKWLKNHNDTSPLYSRKNPKGNYHSEITSHEYL